MSVIAGEVGLQAARAQPTDIGGGLCDACLDGRLRGELHMETVVPPGGIHDQARRAPARTRRRVR